MMAQGCFQHGIRWSDYRTGKSRRPQGSSGVRVHPSIKRPSQQRLISVPVRSLESFPKREKAEEEKWLLAKRNKKDI
jgi:hypothetical protein